MHLHFIFPRWQKLLEDHPELQETVSGYDIGNFRMAGLGLAACAGAVPQGHDLTFIDQNIDEVDYSVAPDLVCIGFFTPQATNAYAIADKFRSQCVRVIAGGIHPTMAPLDTLEHFDAIVEGPVEGLWETILTDLAEDKLAKRYRGDHTAAFSHARRDFFSRSDYLKAGVVQTARGCHIGCDFCVVPQCYGKDVTFRPIADVLADIATLPFPCFFFADENLLFPDSANRNYTRELMQRMIEVRLNRISFTANYPQFIKSVPEQDWTLLAKANMRQVYLVLGLMKPLRLELSDRALHRTINLMKQYDIEVFASFTLGNDLDLDPVEPLIEAFCEQTAANLAEFTLYTPFPGTAVHNEMKRSGRILTESWERYNGANVVFQPLNESPAALEARYLSMWRWFYGRISKTAIQSRYARGFGADILR